jgi:CRP-like cAMP-binding protein
MIRRQYLGILAAAGSCQQGACGSLAGAGTAATSVESRDQRGVSMDEVVDLMSWQDWAANFCYLLLAISYVVTNLFWLRVLAAVALGLEGVYFYFASNPPLWVGIAWAAVFVAVNLVQLLLMTRERMAVRLSEHELLIHRGLFAELTKVQFHRLLKIGIWRDQQAGSVLTTQAAPVPELLFIARGTAQVVVDGKLAAFLQPGSFIGEMSFMTGDNASATVIADTPMHLFVIAKEKLEALLKGDRSIETAILRVIGRDLTSKLAIRSSATEWPQSPAAGAPERESQGSASRLSNT